MGRQSDFLADMFQAGIDAGLSEPAARVMAAQAALETGYGKSSIGNNVFGIKAGKSWTGKKQQKWTWEEIDGKKVKVKAWFRDYDSLEDGIADRIALMDKKWPGFNQAATLADAHAALKIGEHGGYATDSKYLKKLSMIDGKIPGQAPRPPGDIPTAVGSELDVYDPNAGTKVAKGAPIPQTMSEGTRLQRSGVLDSVLETLDRDLHLPTKAEKGPVQFQPYPLQAKGSDLILAGQKPSISDRVIPGGGLATQAGLDLTPTLDNLMAGGKPIPRPGTYVDATAKPATSTAKTGVAAVTSPVAKGVKAIVGETGAALKGVQSAIKMPKIQLPEKGILDAITEAGKQGPLSGFVRDEVQKQLFQTVGGAAKTALQTQAEKVAAGKAKAAADAAKVASAPKPLPKSAATAARINANSEFGFGSIADALGAPAPKAAASTGTGNTTMAADLALLFATGDAKLPTPSMPAPASTKTLQNGQMKIDPSKVAPIPKPRLMGSVARALAEEQAVAAKPVAPPAQKSIFDQAADALTSMFGPPAAAAGVGVAGGVAKKSAAAAGVAGVSTPKKSTTTSWGQSKTTSSGESWASAFGDG